MEKVENIKKSCCPEQIKFINEDEKSKTHKYYIYLQLIQINIIDTNLKLETAFKERE